MGRDDRGTDCGFYTPSSPEYDVSLAAAAISEFASFSDQLQVLMTVAALTYFYFAVQANSLADYRDVLVSAAGVVMFIQWYTNFFDALEDRLYYNATTRRRLTA